MLHSLFTYYMRCIIITNIITLLAALIFPTQIALIAMLLIAFNWHIYFKMSVWL